MISFGSVKGLGLKTDESKRLWNRPINMHFYIKIIFYNQNYIKFFLCICAAPALLALLSGGA